MQPTRLTRRRFLCHTAGAIPVGVMAMHEPAAAQDLPHLAPDDPMAAALHYVEDATAVDTTNPQAARYQPGQTCANCIQMQGDEGDEWRPCTLFPGKLVAAGGWCSVWAARPE